MVEPDAAAWRMMTEADFADVERVGALVHPDYPEDAGIIVERRRLYPAGCHVLASGHGLQGYAISHPWSFGRPPPLNTPLRALPAQPDTYYIHDIALLPALRGSGLGSAAVARLAREAGARGLRTMSLVAVGRSARFWQRHGFEAVERADIRAHLASYGQGATFMAR